MQWERVAHCESGDNWHINTGNGYYGGLQFSASTWSSYDVDNFASRADLATRNQQIDVANRVLNSQGWNAWPVCSQYAGAPGPSHRLLSHHHAKVGGHGKWVHYTVKPGDTLAEIARRHHVKGGWHAIYRHNRHVIGANPSMIHVGDEAEGLTPAQLLSASPPMNVRTRPRADADTVSGEVRTGRTDAQHLAKSAVALSLPAVRNANRTTARRQRAMPACPAGPRPACPTSTDLTGRRSSPRPPKRVSIATPGRERQDAAAQRCGDRVRV